MARMDCLDIQGAAGGASADTLFQLGTMFSSGRDVSQDLVTAHKWFNLAALRGNGAARRYRMEISQEMSKIEVAKAQRMAREWLTRN